MNRLSWVLMLALMGGCKSSSLNDGYAIDLTIVLDSSIADADVARIIELDLTVSGSENAVSKIPATGKFTNRTAGLRYKPVPQATGLDTFSVNAVDASGKAVAGGKLDVPLKPGTQLFILTLYAELADGGVPVDMNTCGNGVVDPGETCDPGPGSAMPCPKSVSDCDDANDCTNDVLNGMGCQAACAHTPVMNGSGCMVRTGDAGLTGVCQGGACCTGCIKNGACLAGSTDATACGSGGNSCFDCSSNGATCAGGTCTGCGAASCGSRACGTSSCGYNCGACPDQCLSGGTLNHFACSASGTCAPNGGTNCGLYVTCANSSICNTTCTGDGDCISTAWCNQTTNKCVLKSGLGGPCSAETTGDHECASPYVCSWIHDGKSGMCVPTRCTGCLAAATFGTNTGCNVYVDYGADPRHFCMFQDACHQAFCSGQNLCDFGQDQWGNYRACGAVTCTNNAKNTGTVVGYQCTDTMGCQPNQTNLCNPFGSASCFPCASPTSGCDATQPHGC